MAPHPGPIRIGTGTTVKDYDWYRRWLEVGEAAGFELLSTGDSQSLWGDPFVSLAVSAQVTTRPRLGVVVSNPQTRHPAVVASSLVALQQLSGGRMFFGVSSGDSALRNIGVRPATVAEIEAFVVAVRGLCAGETVTWQGTELQLRWGPYPVPVWMAAEGPRTQRLAGRLADGVVLSNALSAEAQALARENIAHGAREAGRAMEDIEIWCMAAMCLSDTEEAGIHALRSQLAGTANHVYRFHTDGKGLPERYRDAVEELKRRYDSRHHANPATAQANAALVEELGLIDYLAARSVIAGPPARCAERIREVAALGASNLIVSQFIGDQLEFMRTFAEEIFPALRGAEGPGTPGVPGAPSGSADR